MFNFAPPRGFFGILALIWHVSVSEFETSRQVVKTCRCGRHFTLKAWRSLPLLGFQATGDDRNDFDLELRNCSKCNSTISIAVNHRRPS